MELTAGWLDLCKNVADCGLLLIKKGCCDSSRKRTVIGNFEKVLGLSLVLFAGFAAVGMAQDTSQYPHGPLDCAHGSTVYDRLRSQDNEDMRSFKFVMMDICRKGIKELVKTVGEVTMRCLPDGTLVK